MNAAAGEMLIGRNVGVSGDGVPSWTGWAATATGSSGETSGCANGVGVTVPVRVDCARTETALLIATPHTNRKIKDIPGATLSDLPHKYRRSRSVL